MVSLEGRLYKAISEAKAEIALKERNCRMIMDQQHLFQHHFYQAFFKLESKTKEVHKLLRKKK